ncbi:hypothetical protein [Desulfobulbus alkaliphilus]|uniref:hypothetical protein n=1 Tax=Desulfobulbus alkaliphilus TaxID=869814 RepID=UPI0019630BF3|nr:hypothetical protein [Desulfobulbus alkaliphilus]MBM9537533.1 hypothetical protein [Desulfobulbus alkaliphilus]
MFNRKVFSDMRRAGMDVGVSKAKLSEAMLDVLLQLPMGSSNLKQTIVARLGLIGQMATTRDLNEAWTQTKKKAAKLYPDKFILDGRNNLKWNDGTVQVIDKYISPANYKKLNELAVKKECSVNAIIAELLKAYSKDVG